MAPQSRGNPIPGGFQSKSTPTLPTVRSLNLTLTEKPLVESPNDASDSPNSRPSPVTNTSSGPSELASVEDNAQPDSSLQLDELSDSDSNDDDSAFTSTARLSQAHIPISRSHTHLPHRPISSSGSGLFPPFYNRPPTPLPPSPSLTSLLRPSFSTQTSRPTTPDSSDVEVSSHIGTGATTTPPSSTAAAVAKSARTATTVPRASPKVPTYEYYGFALYLASSAAFVMYLLWAFLPSPFLHQLGIHYYPDRWWALAVPAWLIMAVAFVYVALASYNVEVLTRPMGSVENLVDECGMIALPDWKERKLAKDAAGDPYLHRRRSSRKGRKSSTGEAKSGEPDILSPLPERKDWRKIWSEGTDAVMDIPLGGVCEILYGDNREMDDESGD